MTQIAPSLSLCMIVRNEAHNLARSLEPVARLFDQVVVVDTGSTDDTPDLAASIGAEVYQIEWGDDFAAARNASISRACCDWIMWLDGDNHISPEGVQQLRSGLDHKLRSILWCTEVVVPQGERLIQKRVFPNRPEVRFQGRVHEQLVHPPDYKSVMTPVEILHWGYENQAASRIKGERNLALLERMAAGNPDDFYVCYQMGRTLLNLRRFDEAASWLNKAARQPEAAGVNPGLYAHAHLLLAQALDRLGRMDEATIVLNDLAVRRPDYGPAFLALGQRSYNGGLDAEAAESLLRFLELGANDPAAGLNPERLFFTGAMFLGRTLERLGDLAGAYAAYEKASHAEGGNPEPLLARARLDLAGRRMGSARKLLTRCLEVSPQNRRAAAMLREAGHA